jgi:hypothetical protein
VGVRGAGEDLAEVGLDGAVGVPLAGVAEGDFFEADASALVGGAHVVVLGDNSAGGEAEVGRVMALLDHAQGGVILGRL